MSVQINIVYFTINLSDLLNPDLEDQISLNSTSPLLLLEQILTKYAVRTSNYEGSVKILRAEQYLCRDSELRAPPADAGRAKGLDLLRPYGHMLGLFGHIGSLLTLVTP